MALAKKYRNADALRMKKKTKVLSTDALAYAYQTVRR
jgi:hypothetical protein